MCSLYNKDSIPWSYFLTNTTLPAYLFGLRVYIYGTFMAVGNIVSDIM